MFCSAFKSTGIWRNIRYNAVQTFIFELSVSQCAFFQQETAIPPALAARR
jgi:hypothetical protein